jgi:hypothetical protein
MNFLPDKLLAPFKILFGLITPLGSAGHVLDYTVPEIVSGTSSPARSSAMTTGRNLI